MTGTDAAGRRLYRIERDDDGKDVELPAELTLEIKGRPGNANPLSAGSPAGCPTITGSASSPSCSKGWPESTAARTKPSRPEGERLRAERGALRFPRAEALRIRPAREAHNVNGGMFEMLEKIDICEEGGCAWCEVRNGVFIYGRDKTEVEKALDAGAEAFRKTAPRRTAGEDEIQYRHERHDATAEGTA